MNCSIFFLSSLIESTSMRWCKEIYMPLSESLQTYNITPYVLGAIYVWMTFKSIWKYRNGRSLTIYLENRRSASAEPNGVTSVIWRSFNNRGEEGRNRGGDQESRQEIDNQKILDDQKKWKSKSRFNQRQVDNEKVMADQNKHKAKSIAKHTVIHDPFFQFQVQLKVLLFTLWPCRDVTLHFINNTPTS